MQWFVRFWNRHPFHTRLIGAVSGSVTFIIIQLLTGGFDGWTFLTLGLGFVFYGLVEMWMHGQAKKDRPSDD